MYTLKQHIEGQCRFVYYRDSQLWYKSDNTGLVFPVPIEDVEGATFHDAESGLMMRYIRKWIKVLENRS